ncbi:MAG: peptidylprolyl isomerase [Candidatus Methylomirabilota bacterium]|nr:MAG: peptidylprolyl isomerase [candidate division NC10 bacterium]
MIGLIVLLGLLVAASASSQVQSEGVVVVLETTMGSIEVTVDPVRAPLSAGDFLRYVDRGLYDEAAFYRVVRQGNDHGTPPIEVVQGGIVDKAKALEPIPHETTEQTGITHSDGVISLARTEPGTGGGSAFFICIGDQPALDFGGTRNTDGLGFAAFGRVTDGMDVVRKIHALPAEAAAPVEYLKGQLLTEPVTILKARRVTVASEDAVEQLDD